MQPELIKYYGYSSETHHVQTDDGYILELHRIPLAENCQGENSKGPALVGHGLFSSSADFVILGPEQGLGMDSNPNQLNDSFDKSALFSGFTLANRCYDVWMGNFRGNHYSRQNNHLDPKDAEFWDFTWHEMGIYDLPVMIDYVLHATGEPDLVYVGHSQGTTSFFVFDEFHPEHRSKVRGAFQMAPIAYLSNTKSLLFKALSLLGRELGVSFMKSLFRDYSYHSKTNL